jgi:hypothetical protein
MQSPAATSFRFRSVIILSALLTSFILMIGYSAEVKAQTTILDQELRDGQLPAGWTAVDITFETSADGYARLSDQTTSVLETPVIDLTGYTGVELQFDVAKFGTGGDGPITVQVSNDGGATWDAQEYDSPTPISSTYLTSTETIIVTGSNVKIRWTRTKSSSQKRMRDVTLTGTIGSSSIITTSPIALTNLDYIETNGPSASQSFTVDGSNLTADGSVSISAPSNFEVSTDDVNWSTSDSFSYTGDSFSGEQVFVRLAAGLTEGSYSGQVDLNGGGASATVSVSGEVTPPLPSLSGTEPYAEQFRGFTTASNLPAGWSVDGEAGQLGYVGEWGFGSAGGLRGNGGEDSVLGYQHTSSTGTFVASLELVNNTGAVITDLYLSYLGRVERSDQPRSPVWTVEVDGVEQPALSYSTDGQQDITKYGEISGLNIADQATFTITWSSDRGDNTTGLAKQIGISDVVVSDNPFFAGSLLGSEGYRILATPASDATYDDVLGRIWTQGFPNSDGPAGSTNVFLYDETTDTFGIPGDISDLFGTQSSTGSSTGKGAFVYTFADDDYSGTADAFPKLLLYEGSSTTGSVNLPLSYTDQGTPEDDGWHLAGNPYNSTLDWLSVVNNNRNVNMLDIFYIYDHNLDAYRLLNGTPATGSDNVANGNNLLPPHQGGWVKATNAGASSLTFETSDTLATGAELLEDPEELAFFRMQLRSQGRGDYAGFTFSELASTGIDADDAYQLGPLTNRFAHLYSVADGFSLLENNLPLEFDELNVPLGVYSSLSGKQRLIWSNVSELPEEWSITLEDTQTGEQTNMRQQDSYVFIHSVSKAEEKNFEMVFNQDSPRLRSNDKQEERFIINIRQNATSAPPAHELPQNLSLSQNYPNPFNPVTQIAYELPERAEIRLEVFNIQGQRVATLVDATQAAGSHSVRFDAGNLSSGVYLYRLQSGSSLLSRKMTLVK